MTISDTARNRAKQIIDDYAPIRGAAGDDPELDLLRRELEADLQGDIDREVAVAKTHWMLEMMKRTKEGA